MKLEVGKKYRLNNGEEHVCESGKVIGYVINGNCYTSTGKLGGFSQYDPRSVACEVKDDQYKPLREFAPFKAGDRFRDEDGDVLTICDDCKTLAWTKIDGEDYPVNVASYSIDNRTTPVTPLDRDEDTPKLWRDMTDSEKGALLLAHHEGKVIEIFLDWDRGGTWVNVTPPPNWLDEYAYRVRPEPSFLPLEAGKTYQTSEKGYFDCIHVRNGNAWLIKRNDIHAPAYVWDAETGKSESLGENWDIVGLEEV